MKRTPTAPRTCETCGGKFHRRRGETVAQYEVRRYGSNACRGLAHQSEASRAAAATVRYCALKSCAAVLVRRDDERPNAFAKRLYCGVPCRDRGVGAGNVAVRVGDGDGRSCALDGCDAELLRREGETMNVFRRRKFCGREHAAAARSSTPSAAPAPVEATPAGLWRPGAWRDPALRHGEARDPVKVARAEGIRRAAFRRPPRRVLAST